MMWTAFVLMFSLHLRTGSTVSRNALDVCRSVPDIEISSTLISKFNDDIRGMYSLTNIHKGTRIMHIPKKHTLIAPSEGTLTTALHVALGGCGSGVEGTAFPWSTYGEALPSDFSSFIFELPKEVAEKCLPSTFRTLFVSAHVPTAATRRAWFLQRSRGISVGGGSPHSATNSATPKSRIYAPCVDLFSHRRLHNVRVVVHDHFVEVETTREIQPGEELVLNYGMSVESFDRFAIQYGIFDLMEMNKLPANIDFSAVPLLRKHNCLPSHNSLHYDVRTGAPSNKTLWCVAATILHITSPDLFPLFLADRFPAQGEADLYLAVYRSIPHTLLKDILPKYYLPSKCPDTAIEAMFPSLGVVRRVVTFVLESIQRVEHYCARMVEKYELLVKLQDV
eukprot:PhF_6_TR3466/c0_g1_i1/m.5076